MNADKALELARKAYPNNEELRVAYMLGLNEGYELHRDEMMKEAVEGEVVQDLKGVNRVKSFSKIPEWLHFGDKVKIIIVKED